MCETAMERRGLKVNNGKMKILVSKNEILYSHFSKYPCASVVVGFVVNSVRCIECTKLIPKQCSK